MSTEITFRELKQRSENIATRKTRAQFELDNATAKFQEARRVLKEEFGLSSGEEIKSELAKLEADRDALLKSIEADLTDAGA